MSDHVDIVCGNCGIEFCMPASRQQELRKTHETFYCPNGCPRHYPGKTQDEKKIEQLEDRVLTWQRIASDRAAERDEAREAARTCPFETCDYRVSRAHKLDSIRLKLADHLITEHNAEVILEGELVEGEEQKALNP